MKGLSESQCMGKTNFLKQEMFKPRLAGKAKDRANSLTLTAKCHVTNLLKATIDAG